MVSNCDFSQRLYFSRFTFFRIREFLAVRYIYNNLIKLFRAAMKKEINIIEAAITGFTVKLISVLFLKLNFFFWYKFFRIYLTFVPRARLVFRFVGNGTELLIKIRDWRDWYNYRNTIYTGGDSNSRLTNNTYRSTHNRLLNSNKTRMIIRYILTSIFDNPSVI